MSGITTEARARLRQPFAASAVKWVPVGGLLKDGSAVMLMPHINASLVFERLSEVDPSWTHDTRPMINNTVTDAADPFGLKHSAPWKCSMTLCGVTRHGIGQLDAGAKVTGMHLKTGYSDAIKRAALEFELGAYLRAIDSVYLPKVVDAKEMFRTKSFQSKVSFSGLTADGKRVLAQRYTALVDNKDFVKRYGAAIEYGDAFAQTEERDDVEIPDAPTAASEQVDDTQADVLILMAGYNGRDTTEDVVRETLKTKPFARCLPQMLSSVKANLAVNTDDAERLRKLALTAAEGDEGAFAELASGLEQLQTIAQGDEAGEES